MAHLKFKNDILGKVEKPFIWSFNDLITNINLPEYTSNRKCQEFSEDIIMAVFSLSFTIS